jgi:hypothetical protein
MDVRTLDPTIEVVESYKDFAVVAGVHTIDTHDDRICYVTIAHRGLEPIYVTGSRYPLLNFSRDVKNDLTINKLSAILDASSIPKGYVISLDDVEELYKKIVAAVVKLGDKEREQ